MSSSASSNGSMPLEILFSEFDCKVLKEIDDFNKIVRFTSKRKYS